MRCKLCGGMLAFLGALGFNEWFRCRHCGMEWAIKQEEPPANAVEAWADVEDEL